MTSSIAILICLSKDENLHIERFVNSIKNARNSDKYNYHFYVASPNDISTSFENVKILKDPGTGSCEAFNLLAKESTGDYLLCLTEGVGVPDNFFDVVDVLNSLQYKLTSFSVGSGHCSTSKNSQILRFPCLSREVLEKELDGVIFNSNFKHHYMDNWLADWTTFKGNPCSEAGPRLHDLPHPTNHEHDAYDSEIYQTLVNNYTEDTNYNIQL
jgi:hypothetical protein